MVLVAEVTSRIMASAAIKRAVPQEPYPGIEPLGGVVVVVSAQVEEGALVTLYIGISCV